VLLDEVDDQREGRSSSAAKKADADRKIAFARRSSRTSRSNCAIFSASLVLVPGRAPASTSACITQPRSVSALIPSCSPIRTHALGRLAGSLRASNVNLIARSRSSSGYFRGAAIADPPWLDGVHQTRHKTAAAQQQCQAECGWAQEADQANDRDPSHGGHRTGPDRLAKGNAAEVTLNAQGHEGDDPKDDQDRGGGSQQRDGHAEQDHRSGHGRPPPPVHVHLQLHG